MRHVLLYKGLSLTIMLKRILSNEKGNAITILFLLLVPLLLTFMIATLDHSRSVYGTDLDLQQALNDGCRAAAMQVEPYSQAIGDPVIVPEKAYIAFKDVVSSNLALQDMTVTEDSPISSIDYYFLVPVNDVEMLLYSDEYPDGTLVAGDVDFNGLTITYDDKLYIEAGEKTFTVNVINPSVIAVARANLRPILGNLESIAVRYSSARVVSNFPAIN